MTKANWKPEISPLLFSFNDHNINGYAYVTVFQLALLSICGGTKFKNFTCGWDRAGMIN